MKALSFWAPWPPAIINHGKRVENRTKWTACNYRGPILIHAALSYGGPKAYDATVCSILDILETEPARRPEVNGSLGAWMSSRGRWVPSPEAKLGGIVGRCDIVNVVRDELDIRRLGLLDQMKWWQGGFALVLDNVEPLPFVPWKGKQGWFEVPDDYATRAAA